MSLSQHEISLRIKRWLIEESDIWRFDEIEDPTVVMNLVAKSNNRNVNIIVDDLHDKVTLITSMNFSKQQKNSLSLLPSKEKNRFIPDLLMALYKLGLLARHSNSSKDKIEKFIMEKLIYFDGLTKDKFFESLFTMLLGIDTLQQYFNRLSLISNDGTVDRV
jgi:hypothetical protein